MAAKSKKKEGGGVEVGVVVVVVGLVKKGKQRRDEARKLAGARNRKGRQSEKRVGFLKIQGTTAVLLRLEFLDPLPLLGAPPPLRAGMCSFPKRVKIGKAH